VDIVHSGAMPWGENLASHRQGSMAHKVLFEGAEGRADNYVFVLAREGSDYFSPRHRHAWDQVRFCLEGAVPLGRDLTLDAGEVAYFPEGVPYGPHEGGPDRIVLLLQFGGSSGLGYLSARQLREARDELRAEGVFEGGVFRRTSGDGKKNLDAYEAIWRHVTGRPIDYPRPRYKAPIVIRPEGFEWRPVDGAPAVRRKALASFPERGLSLDFIRIDADAGWSPGASDALRLIFVRTGQGACGEDAFQTHSAVRLEPGETADFRASGSSELFVITVPPVTAEPQPA
jgi:hypothetical protein